MNPRNRRLKQRLMQPEILIAPGAADALVAKIIERCGFDAVYLTGAGVAYTTLGKPDMGFITMSEMVQKAGYIAEAVSIPVIADIDNGYGNALNVLRTVREFERAGVSCLQMEDQVFPKRCGHLEGKELISKEEMVAKIKAAVDARTDEDLMIIARTDALAVEGTEAAIERALAYKEAGADILFVEAPRSEEILRRITAELPRPLMANMVEGGKTPLIHSKELEKMGFDLVIYPGASVRVIAKAVTGLMTELKETGTTQGYLDRMFLFNELNEIVGLPATRELEQKYRA